MRRKSEEGFAVQYMYGIVHRTEECHGNHSDDAFMSYVFSVNYYQPVHRVRSLKCVINPHWRFVLLSISGDALLNEAGQTGKPLRCSTQDRRTDQYISESAREGLRCLIGMYVTST
jgi:hypothetical protein